MNLADVTSAALLIRFALGPKERPTTGSPYRALLDRYVTDTGFAEIVSRVADGLGLDLRQPTPLGLLVSGRGDGPFAVTLENSGLPIRTGQNRLQDRRCFGLVLVAVAAFAYPNGEALIETGSPTVRPVDLERFLDRNIGAVVEAAAGVEDELDGQLGEAARMWQDLPEVLPAQHGGLKRDCRRDYVLRTLEFLVTTGRARREPSLDDERGKAYMLNDRFRVGLAETTESLVFAALARGSEQESD
ncbi:hypothetical protein [Saccharothrix algeriensis]|uniref:Uncharacterized protein n=1 Tax=Saccharothrix algeriensis TaxID=173560 RepID=A0A8T8HVX3_9PSEU|nr:hypothetical protein [Saccharothrix algeriensis]MBM7814377.1 hypothetical protein [Saccharothrix algeriensis]QTR02698.1 hypothetical protein J7S33_27165 [Saccharothrix algeriensis]